MPTVTVFLAQVLVILLAQLILSQLFRSSVYLPLVAAQLLIGLALGPSVLGHFAPRLAQALFSSDSLRPLTDIATCAVILFAFTSGMHLNLSNLRRHGRALCLISAASMLVPGTLGFLAGEWILRHYADARGPAAQGLSFSFGTALCCAVTALPVLAALLRESGLTKTRIGQTALAVAAVNDALLWVLLGALLVSAGPAHRSGYLAAAAPLWLLPAWALSLNLLKLAVNLCKQYLAGKAARRGVELVLACAVALGLVLLAERCGLHYALGAFLAGTALPRSTRKLLVRRMEPFVATFLMPFYFMSIGLKTSLDAAPSAFAGMMLAVTSAAMLGKVGGVAMASRWVGESWRSALALGALAQTKGLMEVVVVTVLLDAGVFSSGMFTALVLMAIFTTCLAMPMTGLLLGRRAWETSAARPLKPEPDWLD